MLVLAHTGHNLWVPCVPPGEGGARGRLAASGAKVRRAMVGVGLGRHVIHTCHAGKYKQRFYL